MSDVNDLEIDELNHAMWEHYIEKYEELLPKWIENKRKGQWVALDYDSETFFENEIDAFKWYADQPRSKIMLVRMITDEPRNEKLYFR